MSLICKQDIDLATRKQTDTLSKEEEIITCAFCNNYITDLACQMIVNDSFYHTFANPHGCVFEIGCFSDAKGCIYGSISSNEFSWFLGFSWQIGVCNHCSTHLGWVFSSESDRFYGLILEKLIFP
ncbi:cereblon family protein [Desulfobacula sp.]